MVRVFLFLICVVFCGCMTTPKFVTIGNQGAYLNMSVMDSCLEMKDSAMFSFVLTNPQNDTIMLDSTITILLIHHVPDAFVFYDTAERICYKVFRGFGDTFIRPKGELVLNVMVYLKPEFFYNERNDIYAQLCCKNYYDEVQKKVIKAKHEICVYSAPISLNIKKATP